MRDKILSWLNPDGYDYLFTIMRSMNLPLKDSEVDLYVESWANCAATIAESNGASEEQAARIREQIKGEYAIFKVLRLMHFPK